MEFMQEMKGFCDKEAEEEEEGEQEEEEEEEEEEEVEIMGGEVPCRLPFISSSSSSCASPMYRGLAPPPPSQHQQQRMWLGTLDAEEESSAAARSYDQRGGLELEGGESSKRLEFVNLSLRNNEEVEVEVEVEDGGGGRSSGGGGEKEHMFDKVVTPSDVGKLNRLVIPKQHAEKYFPLDSSASDKGLLLNFEDRDGKPWRFRYSYWNSSQSYVMTKGWSRFVKEKKLDAGDIVSFHRGLGDSGKDRLYIDWRRRPDAPDPTSLSRLHHHPFSSPSSFRWGRLYSLPQSLSSINIPSQFHDHNMHHHLNYSTTIHPYHRTHPHHRSAGFNHDYNAYYPSHQIGAVQPGGGGAPPVVINSVPVVHGKTTAKRLRLFGVNMECPTPDDHTECSSSSNNVLPSTAIPHVTAMAAASSSLSPPHHHHHLPASSSLPPLQLRLCNGSPIQAASDEFPKKGKTSLSFDLDL